MSKTAPPNPQPKCPCGNPLKTKDEKSIDLCQNCLDTGIPTERSKVPIPEGSCLNDPQWENRKAFDRLLWLVNWWVNTAEQCCPEDCLYIAARLEELAAKITRTV
jgi:hypothetical protein